jgi:hypothetical protein
MAEKTLKSELAKIGWDGFVGWRAKELLDYYRRVRGVYGNWSGAIKNSAKIAHLRRNRMLVKATGKGFADFIQIEFGFSANTKVEYFPEWYENPSEYNPYRVRLFEPRQFSVLDIEKPYVTEADYKDYTLVPTKFGDRRNRRMAAAYLAESDTVYISKIWVRD